VSAKNVIFLAILLEVIIFHLLLKNKTNCAIIFIFLTNYNPPLITAPQQNIPYTFTMTCASDKIFIFKKKQHFFYLFYYFIFFNSFEKLSHHYCGDCFSNFIFILKQQQFLWKPFTSLL